MIDTDSVLDAVAPARDVEIDLGPEPDRAELRALVREFRHSGLCGRRIAQQHLGPHFLASDDHGQREIELLEEVLAEEYADSELCVRERASECSRLRGGCRRFL